VTVRPELAAVVARHPRGAALTVSVAPRASFNRLELRPDGSIRLQITAPPVEGAANSAMLTFLAAALDVPRSRLVIASGENSRHKRIVVEGLTPTELATRLDAALGNQ
jgi:uncharacterized protein (TIGR00251 family)